MSHAETLPAEIARAIVNPKSFTDLDVIHNAYTWARNNNPLARAELEEFDPFWVVTKYADVAHVSRNNDLFHNADYATVLFDKATIKELINITGEPHLVRTLPELDNPDHRKLRAITQSWFMPNNIAKLEGRVGAIARSAVERMATMAPECDFVNAVALGYPLHVVMDILGVPPEDEPRMLMLTQQLFSPEDPELNRDKIAEVTPDVRAKMLQEAVEDFETYFDRITDDRRANPRDDVATVIANATMDGEPLSRRYRNSYYIIVASAGHDTTSSSTGTGMWALCQYPELLQRMKDDPALIPGFIDETIRWSTPVRHFMRSATADTELRGRKIAKGDWLMLCYGSANRDEEIFEAPFEFRIDRKPNRHLAFGYGAHVCLGQHLARLEMNKLFAELIPRLESVEFAGPMELSAANFVGGPKRLPIRFKMR